MRNDTRIAVDVAKAVFEIGDFGSTGTSGTARAPAAGAVPALLRAAAGGDGGHGGLRFVPPLGREASRARSPRGAAPTAPRATLRPSQQDRPHRRQGNSRGQPQRRHSTLSPIKTVCAAGPHVAAPAALGMDDGADRADQYSAWTAAGAGRLHPRGRREVVPAVWALIEDADSELPDALRPIFAEACQEIREIEARIKLVEQQLEAMAEQLPAVGQLLTIPGIGLLTATALVAFIGDIRRFPSGRHLASYLGLTPREYSSGLKRLPRSHLQARRRLPAHAPASTARARSCSTPERSSPIASASGLTSSRRLTSTTRPPSRSPTSWPASSGRSGPINSPTSHADKAA